MCRGKFWSLGTFLLLIIMLASTPLAGSAFAGQGPISPSADSANTAVTASHRLIVELKSAPLALWAGTTVQSAGPSVQRSRVDMSSAASQNYVAQLRQEQASFVQAMQRAVPGASVSDFINETGARETASYQVVFNGLSIDPGNANRSQVRQALLKLPNVKNVYLDLPHASTLYTSTTLINAPAIWNLAAVGGQAKGGQGIKVASVDGGVHKDAPMFSGVGYSYPEGWPAGGLGLTANNNGKIIASRAYFRTWDPPAPGDENPWPGVNGTSHGVHTAGIAAGNVVNATYGSLTFPNMSGVAPKAWIMSYRVFYASVNDDGSFYNTEGIAALEDAVIDGADVINNSWGGGPTSIGGEFDALDTALINATNAGVFVSMSAGNAGPGGSTTDHPSSNYIDVAASTTSGTLAAGRLNVTAPAPVPAALQGLEFASSSFGEILPFSISRIYPYLAAGSVDPGNITGCNAWPSGTFTNKAALIERGGCEFGVKVLNAEQAGAKFVVVYNSAAGGNGLINMGPGAVGSQVTIPSIFIGRTNGVAMVDWYTNNGAASTLEINTEPFQAGNEPDVLASFSSRGPGVGNVLKPDITAPGVNILSQGYTEGATGEASHLGYGQASGTSMAAPHVAGAAALILQVHPDWSPAAIKSAMMSTSKYMDIYDNDGTPAQPLDMGAGRLDLTRATDPGVILSPPSLSFGLVAQGSTKSIQVTLTSVGSQAETYNVSTLFTGNSFTQTTTLPGFSVSPTSVTLAPGASAVLTVSFDSTTSQGLGDNQGYIVLDGTSYDAHMPAWARVTNASQLAKVLVLDNDRSTSHPAYPDYRSYYTNELTALGYSYQVWDIDAHLADASKLPDITTMLAYDAILYFTGDNFNPLLTLTDKDRLAEYANNGRIVIAMGQDLASALAANTTSPSSQIFIYNTILGANWLQDSVSNDKNPTLPIIADTDAPPAFRSLRLDVSGPEVYAGRINLAGANEVPAVTTTTTGSADIAFNVNSRVLDYSVTVTSTTTINLTASHIHTGTVDVSGPILYPLYSGPNQAINGAFTFSGSLIVAPEHVDTLLSEGLYINVHTTDHPDGEIRGQISLESTKDGAGNQFYIDEIEPHPPITIGVPVEFADIDNYTGLLMYPGPYNEADGSVAVSHRDQPSLERPGISYTGRSIYTSFGLEGVNNTSSTSSRSELLKTFFNWAHDVPTSIITPSAVLNSKIMTFEAGFSSTIPTAYAVSYRWDFGDGSAYSSPFAIAQASHTYQNCGSYTVRVEVTDNYGNRTVSSQLVNVGVCTSYKQYMPMVFKP